MFDEQAPGVALQHRYVDNQNGIDGLDNVRRLLFDNTRQVLYAVSADDDALTAYHVADDLSLTMLDMMSGNEARGTLVGASDMTFSGANQDIQVISFYSGAVAQFRLQENDSLRLLSYLTDSLDIQRVFRQSNPISAEEDTLGLLGPYAIVGSDTGASYVAANVSQALVKVTSTKGRLDAGQILRASQVKALAGAVSVALSEDGELLAVAGMQASQIAVFKMSESQSLTVQQILPDEKHQTQTAPLFVTFVPGAEDLMVATQSGVFRYVPDPAGRFKLAAQLNVAGSLPLAAVTRMAFSPDGQCMLALSESTDQVNIFARQSGGDWQFADIIDVEGGQSPTSAVFLTPAQVAISFAKSDAVHIYANVCAYSHTKK
ncbi:lactonase family protein [Pseudoalteromonas sp. OOF1S-7]|uniref:lactonase family protein n=1 Tax=Pseudoalteromonas sp. OOF1S-7 TaxID=2917757 RepID=UPI001EF3FBED|nr:lactonase family protein [Pseudoalteromonas sp. OOF1S-7]MCG7536089.1 lactonase family protein [Pseudoalteromonas sp. OOF1S-7]